MSNSLVKQSLQLFEDMESSTTDTGSKKKTRKDPMKLISTRKKGVKKELKKLQKQQTNSQTKNTKKTSVLEQYWRQQPEDYTEASVGALQKLSSIGKTGASVSKTILDYHEDKVSRVRRKDKEKTDTKQEESTVFTDDDFEKFAKEYDFLK